MTDVRDAGAIPHDEELYRAVRPADEGEWLDGEKVLPGAIDSQGTSVQRSLYRSASGVLQRFSVDVLIVTTPGQLPREIDVNGRVFEAFAHDCPEAEDEAHAEVRVRLLGDASTEHRRLRKKVKKRIVKDRIAEAFAVRRFG